MRLRNSHAEKIFFLDLLNKYLPKELTAPHG